MIFQYIALLTASTLSAPSQLEKRGVFQNSCKKEKKHIGVGKVPSYGCPEGKWQRGALCYPNGARTLLRPSPMQPTCPAGTNNQAGLCYTNCPAGWNKVGLDCYQGCGGKFSQDCGLGFCSKSKNDCAQIVSLIGGVGIGAAVAAPLGGWLGGAAGLAAAGSSATIAGAVVAGTLGGAGGAVAGAAGGTAGAVVVGGSVKNLPLCP